MMIPSVSDGTQAIQGELFANDGDDVSTVGYRGTVASKVAGITYRQLDYWARKQILAPSVKPSHGSGSRRLYSFKDIVILAVSKRLLDMGVNLQNVTGAMDYLLHKPVTNLEHMTIICDGVNVRECADSAELLDIIQDGTPVFGISVAAQWHRVEQELTQEKAEDVALDNENNIGGPLEDLAANRLRQKLQMQHDQRREKDE